MTDAASSSGEIYRAAVFGASGGLGRAFVQALDRSGRCEAIHAFSRSGDAPEGEAVRPGRFDLTDEASIESAVQTAFADGPVQLVICATGVLHGESFQPEKSWRQLDAAAMAKVYALNTIGPALIGKHALPRFKKGRKSVYAALSARVGSISDNRLGGWHSYRASKAALNQILRNFAIELARKNPDALCVGLHPGTVDTGLSRPFQGNVPDGKLFSPGYSAGRLLEAIDAMTPEDSGTVFDYDGAAVPA